MFRIKIIKGERCVAFALMSCCCCLCIKYLKWENFGPFLQFFFFIFLPLACQHRRCCWCCISSASLWMNTGICAYVRVWITQIDVSRGAKLAEQSHISTAAEDQGGPGQRTNGQAEILFHLQDLPAAEGLALQPVRQLRGPLRSPLSLGE